MQVDGGEKRQYPFAWCSQVGCFARFGLDKPRIDALKRGKAGKITLVSVGRPEAPVVLDLSLSGFTAAFDSLAAPVLPEGATPPAAAPEAAPAPAPGRPPPGAAPLARAQALRPQPPPARRAAMSASTARTMLSTVLMSNSDCAGSLALNGTWMSKASSMAKTASTRPSESMPRSSSVALHAHLAGVEHRLLGEDRDHLVPDRVLDCVGHAPSVGQPATAQV